jgi:hypothetical protein
MSKCAWHRRLAHTSGSSHGLFLEPGLRIGVDRLALLRATAEVLEAFGASLRVEIYRADVFDTAETSSIFSATLNCVDQLLWLVASQTKPIMPTRWIS